MDIDDLYMVGVRAKEQAVIDALERGELEALKRQFRATAVKGKIHQLREKVTNNGMIAPDEYDKENPDE